MTPRWRHRRVVSAPAAGLVVALTLTACSSGSGSPHAAPRSTARPSTTTTTTTGATTGAGPPTTASAPATGRWTTYGGDPARTGVASDGPPSAAAARRRWVSATLDGEVYAQPLVVGHVVIIATENDTVDALDASTGAIVWTRHLGTPVPGSQLPCGNVDPVGITSTPVVDPAAGRVYAVGMVRPGSHRLWALDLATGAVVGSVGVDVPGSDPDVQNQRSALTLAGNSVYVPFGGRYGDCGAYHGRVTAVDVSRAAPAVRATYTLPTEREGGFWAPPGASLASDGSLFLTSGNSSAARNYDDGNSVVRLTPALTLADSFAPSNWAALNASDTDLGSAGPVLLPGDRVFQIGKGGDGYLLDAAHLGGIGGQLFGTRVCAQPVLGAVAHDGTTVFVPCLDRLVQVRTTPTRFTAGWSLAVDTPGPPIVTADAVWTMATGSGELVAIARDTGTRLASLGVGPVPSRFTSPGAGDGLVVIGAHRRIYAFG